MTGRMKTKWVLSLSRQVKKIFKRGQSDQLCQVLPIHKVRRELHIWLSKMEELLTLMREVSENGEVECITLMTIKKNEKVEIGETLCRQLSWPTELINFKIINISMLFFNNIKTLESVKRVTKNSFNLLCSTFLII